MPSSADVRSWTQPGAQDAAQRTYASVKAALAASPLVQSYDPEIFLQGSYANHTNTRGDSDVDIVVMMRSTYMPDVSLLTAADLQTYQLGRVAGSATVGNLRQAVTDALVRYYGSSRVHSRNKCLRVDKSDGYVDADVVPAMQQRVFTSYPVYGDPSYVEGISIQPLQGERIVNFPKQHIANGSAKNKRSDERYKPAVRQLKRLRRAAVDAGLVGKSEAPGYLLECLTYNVPDDLFAADEWLRLLQVLAFLKERSPEELAKTIKSGDGINLLFQTDPGNHNQYTAHRILQTLWKFL